LLLPEGGWRSYVLLVLVITPLTFLLGLRGAARVAELQRPQG